jgi:hypothetical protein
VPVEHCLGRHEEGTPPLARGEPRQERDQGTVGPTGARTADLAAEHGQLVAQDDNLGVLREGAHPLDAEQLEQATGEAVEERWRRGGRAWPIASSLIKTTSELLDPSGYWARPDGVDAAEGRSAHPGGMCDASASTAARATISPGIPVISSRPIVEMEWLRGR